MKKLLASLMLALVTTSAIAEWTGVGHDGNGRFNIYVDYSTIRRVGNRANMWVLYDFIAMQEIVRRKYLSISSPNEYDCKDGQIRNLAGSSFMSGSMGGGKLVYSTQSLSEWRPVLLMSVDQIPWGIACGRQ